MKKRRYGTEIKALALVAHDNMKRDLAEWVDWNWEILLRHHLVCTGTTGKMVTRTLTERGGAEEISHFDITLLKSARWAATSSSVR